MENQYECYKYPAIVSEVFYKTSMASSIITNIARTENDILEDVGSFLRKDPTNYKKRKYITRIINSKIAVAKKRNRKEHAVHFADISFEDDNGEIIEYDPVDVLANVDSELITKETVNLLAKEDGRRRMILNAWANGFTNDKALSETLASFLGGQARGHCSYIQRFRIECRTTLRPTAI